MKIIQLLGKKLNDYTEKVAGIAFRDVKGRISATLLRLAKEYGRPLYQTLIIDLKGDVPMSSAEITREKHSEYFKSAHTEGVLDLKTKQLLHIAVVLALRCEP